MNAFKDPYLKFRLYIILLWEMGVLIPMIGVSYILAKQDIAFDVWENERARFLLFSGLLVIIFTYVFPKFLTELKRSGFQQRILIFLCWLLALVAPVALLQWGGLLKELYPQAFFSQILEKAMAKLGLFGGWAAFFCWLFCIGIALKFWAKKCGNP